MLYKKTLNFIDKNIIYIIYFIYFFFIFNFYFGSNYFFFVKEIELGYLVGGDSKGYILGSEKILNLEIPKKKSYLGYMFYLAFFKYLNLKLTHVVFSQILLTFLSSICIYKICEKLSSKFGGISCLALYLFYFPLQVYNFYILTETIFICSIIFIIFFIIFFKKKHIPILIFLIIFTILIKPHGILLIPSLFLSAIIWFFLNNNHKMFWMLIFTICILLYPLILLLNLFLVDTNVQTSIAKGWIIWGYEENKISNYKIYEGNNDIISLLLFFRDNIYLITISFFKKIWFFLARVRPYYSEIHNLYIIIFNIIYYSFAIIGFVKINSKKTMGVIFMYNLIFFFILTTGLTYADWDSRFSLYIIPIFFIFGGIGIFKIKNFKKKYK